MKTCPLQVMPDPWAASGSGCRDFTADALGPANERSPAPGLSDGEAGHLMRVSVPHVAAFRCGSRRADLPSETRSKTGMWTRDSGDRSDWLPSRSSVRRAGLRRVRAEGEEPSRDNSQQGG